MIVPLMVVRMLGDAAFLFFTSALSEALKVVGCYFCLRFFGPGTTACVNIPLCFTRIQLILRRMVMPVFEQL